MKKIIKVYNIIKNRLPKTYFIPKIKIYKTVYSMLKAEAKERGKTYKQIKSRYNTYLKQTKESKYNYIKTKYDTSPSLKRKTREKCLSIQALSSSPIKINLQNTIGFNLQALIFLLLHEIGHHYYKNPTEQLVDKFAIRWIKRLLKEKII